MVSFSPINGRSSTYLDLVKSQLLRENGNRCTRCSYDEFTASLQTHHIIPLSEGGIDDGDNLVLLCANCHSAITAGMLKIIKSNGGIKFKITRKGEDDRRRRD